MALVRSGSLQSRSSGSGGNPQDAIQAPVISETGAKHSCCSGRHLPYFPLEKDHPTMALRSKGPGKSVYQKDYVKLPFDKTKDMNNNLWTTFHANAPMDFGTTMRNDYVPLPITKPLMSTAKRPATSHVPFSGKTDYKRQYVDWGGSHSEATVPVQPSTISKDLPFLGRTTYGENYVKPEKEDDFGDQLRNVNKQKRDSPFSPAVPFLGQTTYNKTFQPFQVKGNPERGGNGKGVEKATPYPGQYKTIAQGDFSDPKGKFHCPYRDEHSD